MKILVAAKRVDPDRTSEGICTSKFLRSLVEEGFEVVCLSGEENAAAHGNFGLPSGVDFRALDRSDNRSAWDKVGGVVQGLSRRGRAGRLGGRAIDGVFARATGYFCHDWMRVAKWSNAIERTVKATSPDLLFVRGAGIEFEPHLAVLGAQLTLPWIANYHDPFPLSLYPEPYRKVGSVARSRRQEALHRRIVRQADAISFPARRLLEWVLRGDLEKYRRKAFVLPHISTDLTAPEKQPVDLPFPPAHFNLIHTGTFIENRDPSGLIDAFSQFVDRKLERREKAHLVLIGGVHRSIVNNPSWQRARQLPNVVCVDRRLPFRETVQMARAATASIVVEAPGKESPFFPAKLADAIQLRQPIVALTPRASAVRDLLGADYPLLAEPDDVPAISAALERLWLAWMRNEMDELLPPEETIKSLSPSAVISELTKTASRLTGASPESGASAGTRRRKQCA